MSRQASTVQSSWASSLPSSVSSPPDPAPQPEFGCETPKSATRHARSAAYAASAASAARSLRKRTAAKLRDAFAQRRRIVRPRIAGLAGQSSSEVAQYPTASTSRPVTISTPSRVLLMLDARPRLAALGRRGGLAEHSAAGVRMLVFFFTSGNCLRAGLRLITCATSRSEKKKKENRQRKGGRGGRRHAATQGF